MSETTVRWMIGRDLPQVLAIETGTPQPWSEAQLRAFLRERNCISMVAETGEALTGYYMFELHKNSVRVLRLVVHPDWRRRGVGTYMLERMKTRQLSYQRRTRLACLVPEQLLDMQLFLRTRGFVCVGVAHGVFSGQDCYEMHFDLPGTQV